MKLNNVLSSLIDEGYGNLISEYSRSLGSGLWGIEIDQAQIAIFENGLRYTNVEISYSAIVGIKSTMTMEQISKAQDEKINTLVMRFECESHEYDLVFPITIYSTLLGYFCEQVNRSQPREVFTGFVSKSK